MEKQITLLGIPVRTVPQEDLERLVIAAAAANSPETMVLIKEAEQVVAMVTSNALETGRMPQLDFGPSQASLTYKSWLAAREMTSTWERLLQQDASLRQQERGPFKSGSRTLTSCPFHAERSPDSPAE